MALRSINSTALSKDRRTAMKRDAVAYSLGPGANDENVDLLGSPNCLLPPPSRSKTSSIPVCFDKPICKSLPAPAEAVISIADTSVTVEYTLSENLSRLSHPDGHVRTLLQRLDSRDWVEVFEAINVMRQLALYDSDVLLPLLEQAVPLLIKAMKNPRSALCKTAIMASADLLKSYPVNILTMLEQLLLQLLLKASQDKKFVCEEAEKTLEMMTEYLSPAPLLEQLRPYVTHRNPRVRAKAASCVCRAVSKLGFEGVLGYGLQPLLHIAASQLNDQLPEARECGRGLVGAVHAAYPSYSRTKLPDDSQIRSWDEFCKAELPSNIAHSILRLTSSC